jgi:hypothetical protein
MSLRSYTGRRRIRFLGSALRTTAPDLHHDSSSVKIQGAVSRGHLRRPNRSLLPPLIDDSDSDRDDLSFAFGNLSITLSSTNSSSRYYSCGLILLFFLINMFNMFSIRVVISVVVICDISLNLVSLQHMFNLVVHSVMIYIMILIWKLPNISIVSPSLSKP